jgi:hypothetical protein
MSWLSPVFVVVEKAVNSAGKRGGSGLGEASPCVERSRSRCVLAERNLVPRAGCEKPRCCEFTKRYLEPRAGCEGRPELSDLLSIRLADVVIVDDESHAEKPRDVASPRSGILCHLTVSRSGEIVAKPREKAAAAAAVLEYAFCRP